MVNFKYEIFDIKDYTYNIIAMILAKGGEYSYECNRFNINKIEINIENLSIRQLFCLASAEARSRYTKTVNTGNFYDDKEDRLLDLKKKSTRLLQMSIKIPIYEDGSSLRAAVLFSQFINRHITNNYLQFGDSCVRRLEKDIKKEKIEKLWKTRPNLDCIINILISFEILKLFHKNKAQSTNDAADNQPQPIPLNFTRLFTDKEQQNLFNGLVIGNFIPKDTNHDHFSFVFGGSKTADFKPLRWIGKVALLAYFIDNGFADTDGKNLWKITESCFTLKGQKPNIDSLKNAVSKYKQDNKDKPKDHNRINDILINL